MTQRTVAIKYSKKAWKGLDKLTEDEKAASQIAHTIPLVSHAHIVMPCDTFSLIKELVNRLGGELIPDDSEYITVPPMPEKERVGRMLRGARVRANMTQKDLAKAIGVPQGHISEYEANKRPIPAAKVTMLAKLLNTVEGHFTPR